MCSHHFHPHPHHYLHPHHIPPQALNEAMRRLGLIPGIDFRTALQVYYCNIKYIILLRYCSNSIYYYNTDPRESGAAGVAVPVILQSERHLAHASRARTSQHSPFFSDRLIILLNSIALRPRRLRPPIASARRPHRPASTISFRSRSALAQCPSP